MDQNEKQKKAEERQARPWLEWVASGTGFVLAAGAMGYLLWNGITDTDQPPAVQIRAERIVEQTPGYTVEIRAVNTTRSPASTVVIEGELIQDGQTIETSETIFNFVPGRSEAHGGLYFTHDPRALHLELRPKGYTRP